jgi:hypothetical protein
MGTEHIEEDARQVLLNEMKKRNMKTYEDFREQFSKLDISLIRIDVTLTPSFSKAGHTAAVFSGSTSALVKLHEEMRQHAMQRNSGAISTSEILITRK